MYWSEKDRRFYDSELDYCFGNERKTPKVTYKNEFDGLMDVQNMTPSQPEKEVNFEDIFLD